MEEITIIPLGGVREKGKNMYVVEINQHIFILDCGLKYPENNMLGIDIVIPDFSYLVEQQEKISGVFLTHGHVDAIGALPYLLEQIEVPVFGTELTIELAKLAVKDYPPTRDFDQFHIINEHSEIDFFDTTISFFRTTHTIPDSMGIVLNTSEGSIVYTGDFKFDQSAKPMYQTDFARLADIGKNKVLFLLSDSTGSEDTELIASETQIEEEMYDTFKYWEGRVIVAGVAYNLQRIQQVFNAAYKTGRKVVLTGKELERIIHVALSLNKLQLIDDNLLISFKDMKHYDDSEIIILETGNVGEPLSALQKMAKGYHRHVKIKEGDLVYLITTPSVSMETALAKTQNLLYCAGAETKSLHDNINISGHANQNDLKLMLNLLKPTYFVPVQGEYSQLLMHANLAQELGIAEDHIFILNRGEKLVYQNKEASITGTVPAENVMIDGLGIGDIGNIVLRDRRILSEDGIFIVVTTISRKDKKIIALPKITSRGFVYLKTSKDLLKESASIVENTINNYLQQEDFDWGALKQEVRDNLSSYLFEQTKRRPVILPVIMEASMPKLKRHKNNPTI